MVVAVCSFIIFHSHHLNRWCCCSFCGFAQDLIRVCYFCAFGLRAQCAPLFYQCFTFLAISFGYYYFVGEPNRTWRRRGDSVTSSRYSLYEMIATPTILACEFIYLHIFLEKWCSDSHWAAATPLIAESSMRMSSRTIYNNYKCWTRVQWHNRLTVPDHWQRSCAAFGVLSDSLFAPPNWLRKLEQDFGHNVSENLVAMNGWSMVLRQPRTCWLMKTVLYRFSIQSVFIGNSGGHEFDNNSICCHIFGLFFYCIWSCGDHKIYYGQLIRKMDCSKSIPIAHRILYTISLWFIGFRVLSCHFSFCYIDDCWNIWLR